MNRIYGMAGERGRGLKPLFENGGMRSEAEPQPRMGAWFNRRDARYAEKKPS